MKDQKIAFAVNYGISPFKTAPSAYPLGAVALLAPVLMLLFVGALAFGQDLAPLAPAFAVLANAPPAAPSGEEGKEKKTALQESEARVIAAFEEKTSAFEENLTKFQEQVQTQLKEIEAKGDLNDKLGAELTEAKSALEAQRLELEKMRAQLDRMGAVGASGNGESAFKTMGQRLEDARDDLMETIKEKSSGGTRRPFKFFLKLSQGESLFPTTQERQEKGLGMTVLETKTTITSAAVGSSTPGILVPQRVGYVPAAERRLTIRDALVSSPTQNNTVEFVKENVFTNAASPQVEASAKAESALTFTIDSEAVRTLAHWIPASAQILDDFAQLRRIVDDKMMYGLKLDEEDEILNGSGTGQHLNGLTTQATAYAGTYDTAGGTDTRLDTLRWALLEVEAADEETDLIVISPVTWYTILGIKDQASNVGNYVVGDPIGGGLMRGTTLWGKLVIVTNSMAAAGFLVGDRRQAEIFDRQEANVMISTEHDDYFTKNLVAIRVEERLALAVYRPGAFRYGTFS